MSLHSETIIDAVITELSGISTGNGDSFTPLVVERFDRFNSTKGPVPNIQVARGALILDREDNGGNWRVDLDIDVQCSIFQNEASVTRSDKAVNLAFSDIAAAVIGMDWETLGADLGRIESIPFEDVDENEPETGIVVTFSVRYKLDFDDLTLVVDPS